MAPIFTWSEAFLTHQPVVDQQHQQLVALINRLGALAMSGEPIEPKMLDVSLDAIVEYTQVHFNEEESLMVAASIAPQHLNHHRDEHQAFIHEVMTMRQCSDLVASARIFDLVEYLVQWLVYHMLGCDQGMARQLRAIADGQSPTQAFQEEQQGVHACIEPLLTALNGMFQKLSKRNSELHQLNRDLELGVQERTQELALANAQLQQLATHDDLTGLPNRRLALSSLQQLWLEAERYQVPLSVLLLDADHFKEVNDRFGHAEGDVLLQELATRLRASVRKSDIVCRLGGDEFLIICPRTSQSDAARLARKIDTARQPFFLADGVMCWSGSISIGIAEKGAEMKTAEALLKLADRALYAAKRQTGIRIVAGTDI